MAFLSIDNRTDLPKVSYSTAIDYFLAVCFAFVFASILQFASVHFFTKQGTGDPMPDDIQDDLYVDSQSPYTDSNTNGRDHKGKNETCHGNVRLEMMKQGNFVQE